MYSKITQYLRIPLQSISESAYHSKCLSSYITWLYFCRENIYFLVRENYNSTKIRRLHSFKESLYNEIGMQKTSKDKHILPPDIINKLILLETSITITPDPLWQQIYYSLLHPGLISRIFESSWLYRQSNIPQKSRHSIALCQVPLVV